MKEAHAAILLFFALLLGAGSHASDEAATRLFETHRSALFQIKVIDVPSGNRSALGTGFAIDSNLVATNYHVIAQFLENTGNIEIRLLDESDQEIPAVIVAIDVVADLALLRTEQPLPAKFALADELPSVGAKIYALGNPLDLGMSVTQGNYNGVKKEAFPERVHYSGPVNSGMSGGPTVNENGNVVGVNVATARNSVGFLVPVAALETLWSSAELEQLDSEEMLREIGRQLHATQQTLMSKLLLNEWPEQAFGGAQVPDEGADFISCWGGTSEENDSGIASIRRGCNSGYQVRIKRGFTSTYIEYEFAHLGSKKLGPFRLYNQAGKFFGNARPGNSAREEDVTNFHCVEEHLQVDPLEPTSTTFKTVFCSRAYRELEGLFDAFFVAITTDKPDEMLFAHFTLAGFSQDNIERFMDRFIGSVHWQSP